LPFGDIVLVRMVDPDGVNEKVRRAVVLRGCETIDSR
jgi:hypothetical protein